MIRPVLVGLVAVGLLNAQPPSVTATGKVSVTLTNPLSLNKVQDLNFGTIITGTHASVVEISPSKLSNPARRIDSGDAQLVDNNFNQAIFTAQGAPGANFGVTLPDFTTLTGGGSSMTVQLYQLSAGQYFPSPSGVVNLYLGANLYIGAFQPKGYYSGTFDITVYYP